jgi:putative membrane protein
MGLLLCLAACGGDDDEPGEAAPRTQPVVQRPRIEPLSDGEALAVLSALSASAAEAARAPAELVASPELRRLVNVVRADHTALEAELAEIADSLQITPADHQAAGRIRAAAQQAVTESAQLEWGSADAAVLRQQLNLNRILLAVLDSTVLPGMQASLLQQYAAAVRPAVAAHLQRAEQLEVLLRERAAVAPKPQPVTPAPVDTVAPAPVQPDTGRGG